MDEAAQQLTSEERQDLETILKRIEQGRAVLFVGAGMSMDSGAPSADGLARALCEQFAPGLDPTLGLQRVADLLQSRRGIDRLDIDAWVAEQVDRLQPAPQHLIVPRFAWPAIYTTNYDRLIEKGYDAQPEHAQRLQVVRNATEEYDINDASVVSLFKIHGCTSRLQDPNAPLVLSGADLRRTGDARRVILKRLADLQRAHTWLFVGYSFRDDVIIELLHDLKNAIGEHQLRWSYAVLPHVTEYDRDFLRQFKISAIDLKAGPFFQLLDKRKNRFSPPSALGAAKSKPLEMVAASPQFPALDRQFEVVGLRHFGTPTPASFYRGDSPGWADLEAGLDVRREQADELEGLTRGLLEQARTVEHGRTRALVITGSAGTGKSTLLRRLVYDLYASTGIVLLVAREGAQWEAREVLNVAKAVRQPLVVLFDAAEIDYQRLRAFYRTLVNHDIRALVIIGARTGTWTTAQRRWGTFVGDHTLEINESFTDSEVQALLDKLATHGFIEVNAVTNAHYWLSRARAANRLILVVLLELVQGGRFEEIVLSEYQDLRDGLAEAAYRSVAVVHELGIPLRRELLRRMLDSNWEEFISRVIQGAASKVVIEDFETVTGRGFYRTKHPLLASIIRKNTVPAPATVFKHLLNNVDAAERDDVTIVRAFLKSDGLDEVLPEYADRRSLFEAAVAVLPTDVVVRHQMGINDMEAGQLESARKVFETCLSLSPNNVAVIHSFGLLEMERAKRTASGPLQEMLYNKALKYFQQVIDLDRHSEYGYHSAAALYFNRARDEAKPTQQMLYAGHALEMVELGLTEMDTREAGRLHDLKGQVLELLGQLGAAREEYERTIEQGIATAATYALLARLELEVGHEGTAATLVEDGLKQYEEDARLLALRAELLLRKSASRREIVQVLGPAVRANPKRLSLRFPYAVALYELGHTREAEVEFRRTRQLSEGIFARGRVRRTLQDSTGNNIVFEGTLERTSGRGGFLRARRSDNQDAVYFNLERALGAGLRAGTQVSFEIGFSYLGTIALNLKPLANGAIVTPATRESDTGGARRLFRATPQPSRRNH